MNLRGAGFIAMAIGGVLAATPLLAQRTPSAQGQTVIARVGQIPICAAEVARLLTKVSGGREVNPAVRPFLEAQLLAEIVDRRLVLAYAERTASGPTAAEVERAVAAFKANVTARGQSLDEFLKVQSVTPADLRREMTWRLVGETFRARYATPSRVESYFDAHRREFDGTQVAASHILLRPQADAGVRGLEDAVRRASAIRAEIVSGKLTFADAARKYSAGATAHEGGWLGYLNRHGAMSEAVSRAAFLLEVGQVSEPVKSPHGVHLLRCDGVKPGSKQLAGVRKDVEEALGLELIEKLARAERKFTPVQFTGKAPYFKPGTHELIVP